MHLLQVGVHVTYFLEKGTRVSMRIGTKGFIRDKKNLNLRFLGCFCKAKMEVYEQKD